VVCCSPIGVFDSGIGGLTVLKALQAALPYEDFIYFADTGHLPYGTKDPSQILNYTQSALSWMKSVWDVKLVVAACHTSSVVALPSLRREIGYPLLGMTDAVPSLMQRLIGRKVGLIATPSTVASGVYQRLFSDSATESGSIILSQIPCPQWVPLIESENPAILASAAQIFSKDLEAFQTKSLDTLLYGCTHYPLVDRMIHSLLPEDVLRINPANDIAVQLQEKLKKLSLNTSDMRPGKIRFFCTSNPDLLLKKILYWTDFSPSKVDWIDLSSPS
jgi:glutamate racemase